MKITTATSWREAVALSRPYTIASRTVSAVEIFFVRLESDRGTVGLGAGSPVAGVTGETAEVCAEALAEDRLGVLVGRDPRHLGALCRFVQSEFSSTPAARAALDMALYDLFAHELGVPLVDVLGRCHESLPTSITLGIQSTEEALEETDEYLGRGFRCLKVKIGHDLDVDLERLAKVRERAGPEVRIRIDANEGYAVADVGGLAQWVERLDLELVEQPLPAGEDMRQLPSELRPLLAADESLHGEADALALALHPPACGIFNIKLMKCGGITSGRAIATIAETAGVHLMWGCMDESEISIAAALHLAYACPNTRYLDLDGSFDLARDPAQGGFILDQGHLRIPDRPGLGVSLRES